ncbi:hypothetical protein A2890_02065 [candidate division WWE3 bacterium RIFCSPLOWO2_01_FULL_53_14]|uniref:Uncharacterized protein n=1 Tax=candidate division WWE3 bacterium RIFCSPLOWO2_01_FULL_53_14 TaxID=1802628 RepID=A0A1F4VR97_UNCKA|nr:MAG: hypothetical protein A2890_02065 [candidate division WWE3 bacterium RIFCSPLOWO2_01_FULL_53_14]
MPQFHQSDETFNLPCGLVQDSPFDCRACSPRLKEKSRQLADLLEQLVPHLEKIIDLENQTLSLTKKYYEDSATGQIATPPSNIEANMMVDLGSQIVTASIELTELVGTSSE